MLMTGTEKKKQSLQASKFVLTFYTYLVLVNILYLRFKSSLSCFLYIFVGISLIVIVYNIYVCNKECFFLRNIDIYLSIFIKQTPGNTSISAHHTNACQRWKPNPGPVDWVVRFLFNLNCRIHKTLS